MTARDDALRADLRALADDWERDEAYRCANARECVRCVSFQRAVIRLRTILNAHEAVHEMSQPQGLGDEKGKRDGKQGGVHPDRARQVAEGPDQRGVHAGSGVLDRSGSDPQGRLADSVERGLTGAAPAEPTSAGALAHEPDETRCHCGKYPLDISHALALYDSDDTAIERHAVGACQREASTCGVQYGDNPDRCYHEAGHTGSHSNRWGTTWGESR